MTTDPSEYIDLTVTELEYHVAQMERDMDDLAVAFLATFLLDGSTLINTSANYEHANQSDSVFDEAYKTFIMAFLIYLGQKIIDGAVLTVADFSSRGIQPVGNEAKLVGRMIGFVDGKVVKGGYLSTLGRMSVLRDYFHKYIVSAISSAQKMNQFLKNVKPIFISTDKAKSAFSSYYGKYAYDSLQQATNSIALYIADQRNLTHYEYHGGLVKNSRPFCIEHHGQIFDREDAARFDEQDWRGKIPNVPFLIAVGGWQCFHTIKWLPNTK